MKFLVSKINTFYIFDKKWKSSLLIAYFTVFSQIYDSFSYIWKNGWRFKNDVILKLQYADEISNS